MLGETTFNPNQITLPLNIVKEVLTHVSLFEYPKLSQVNKTWGQLTQLLYPYTLFKILNIISQTGMGEFIQCEELGTLRGNIEIFNTNCFYNMLAVSIVAIGIKKTRSVANLLYKNFKLYCPLEVHVKKTPLFVEIIFDNLFAGPILVDLNNNIFEINDNEALKNKCVAIYDHFLSYMNPILLNCEYKKSDDILKCRWQTLENIFHELDNICYDFNENTIHSLLNEIKKNVDQVDENLSFIYCISINCPNSKKHEKNALQYAAYHAFAIEQYFSFEKNRSLFRIYQSNIKRMSLQDYMKIKGYKLFSDEGCMDHEDLNKYFEDIKQFLKGENEEFYDLCKRCFHSLLPKQSISFYNNDTKTVEGISFRYKTESFNPKNCIQNMLQFLKEQNEASPFFNLQGI